MLSSSVERINALPDDALVLDVGGWAKPLPRADWVLDLMPYETRGEYGTAPGGAERFSADTWVVRDICDREPWPFADGQFDFAVCSHTLEDVRDPIWVCSELVRVARAGYIEVPSRAAEQSLNANGVAGWSHHRWLVEVGEGRIDFVLKPHALHGQPEFQLPMGFRRRLAPEEQVQALWWEGSVEFRERIFVGKGSTDTFLREPVLAYAGRDLGFGKQDRRQRAHRLVRDVVRRLAATARSASRSSTPATLLRRSRPSSRALLPRSPRPSQDAAASQADQMREEPEASAAAGPLEPLRPDAS